MIYYPKIDKCEPLLSNEIRVILFNF
jgi:hypothetical protein